MARPVRAELYQADRELGRFIRYQLAEANRLGYPVMATFARDIARGTLSAAPQVDEDPVMDIVGSFYNGLKQIERRIISDKYGTGLNERQRSKAVGITVHQLRRKVVSVLERCATELSKLDTR